MARVIYTVCQTQRIEVAMLTVSEAAAELEVSPDTIRRWTKKGLIRATRSEKQHRLFDLKELKRAHAKYFSPEPGKVIEVFNVKRKTSYTAIELFSGAGGMALGLENAGIRSRLLVEFDKDAAKTLRDNRPKWNVVQGDVREVCFKEHKDKIDIVAGGFPCQAFSYAGNGHGFEDTRGTLFFDFARCVREVKPKIVLGENVRGLLKHDDGKTLSAMVGVLEDLGYKVAYKIMRAQFMDVPQKRERLIILGIRKDLDLKLQFPSEKDYTISMRDALHECPPSNGSEYPPKKHKILSMIPEGGYWRDLPEKEKKEYMGKSYYLGGGKTGMARRLSWNEPSLTLTCSPAQKQTERCHPEETRPLSVREYARIQTFPDTWEFAGATTSQYKQIGNAVPVNLGYYIGRCLVSILNEKEDDYVKCEAVKMDVEPQLRLV